MKTMNRRQMVKIGVAASSVGICMGIKPGAAETSMPLSFPLNASLAGVGAHTGMLAQETGANSCSGNNYEYDDDLGDPCSNPADYLSAGEAFFDDDIAIYESELYSLGMACDDE